MSVPVQRCPRPDLTTTVLTMTLTGIAADVRAHQPTVVVRRVLAVGTMLLGAVCGALLVLHSEPSAASGWQPGCSYSWPSWPRWPPGVPVSCGPELPA
jgi:hypothetical protein